MPIPEIQSGPSTPLISVAQLVELRSNDSRNSPLVFDCRFSLADTELGRKKYATNHIPAAIYVHLDDDLTGVITPQSGRHPLPKIDDFVRRVNAWGIRNHTLIVVYDDSGGAFATRLWWMMKWIGHTRVALLDGGYAAWQRCRQPISEPVESPIKTNPQSNHQDRQNENDKFVANPNENMLIATDELTKLLQSKQVKLYDARTTPRFMGKHEPIDTVAGHIPGAINLPFEQNLNEHGFFLSADTLKQRFTSIAKTVANDGEAPDTIVHMCGSGVTACHNILAMELAGIEPSRLYAGSWSEWIRNPSRAVSAMTEERK